MWLIYFPFPSSFSLILLLFLNIIMTFLRIVICLYKITIYNHLVMPNNLRHYLVSDDGQKTRSKKISCQSPMYYFYFHP